MQKVESQNVEGFKQLRGRIDCRAYTTKSETISIEVNKPTDIPIDRIDASPGF